jgi:hypothetical protein
MTNGAVFFSGSRLGCLRRVDARPSQGLPPMMVFQPAALSIAGAMQTLTCVNGSSGVPPAIGGSPGYVIF